MARKVTPITITDTQLIWCNFEGVEKQYNDKGDRNFTVRLDDDVAEQLKADGWNVKRSKPREDDEEQITFAYLTVAVSYKNSPPRVTMVTSRGKTPLDEELVGILDTADIQSADIVINPYHWEMAGKTGIKAYLSKAYVVIQEDELDMKYADVEYSSAPGRGASPKFDDPGGAPF